MAKILIVEDDKMMALSLIADLESNGHVVEHAVDGADAMQLLTEFIYELVVLDWELPGMTGLEILKKYRAQGGNAGVLMLTGKSDISFKESGFQAGSDDYLTKPFDVREFEARVNALLRRSREYTGKTITNGNVSVDLNSRTVYASGKEVCLTAIEFSVLSFLLKNTGRSFTVQELLDRVWHSESANTEHAVRQCVSRLRKKISDTNGDCIVRSSKGLGYRIDAP